MSVATTPQYVVDGRGHKKAVILGIDEYQEIIEDLASLALIADAKKGPSTPLETVKKRLRDRGRI